jgi:hypothetical protein
LSFEVSEQFQQSHSRCTTQNRFAPFPACVAACNSMPARYHVWQHAPPMCKLQQRPSRRFWRFATPSVILLLLLLLMSAHAQRGGRFRRSWDMSPERAKEQDAMEKAIDPTFKEDVFTFARLRFSSDRGYGYGGGRGWQDDAPEADYNLIYRLYQVSSLKVRPGMNFIDITTKELAQYPFVYIAAAGRFRVSDEEASALRNYLLNGGFVMVDDFWGDREWHHFYEEIKQVFPDREPVELTLDHPIFHTVFNFKQQPQTPSVGPFLNYRLSYDPADYNERSHEPHYYAIYDDKQRMVAIICHNNHYGDGWEHETEDESYFDQFSEPMAYSMFMNILVYAMAH